MHMATHQLIAQLGKLKDSAKEAIANANTPIDDELKNYLHICRPVEATLTQMIINASQSPHPVLLMVCGNVGDGKSHLLARLKGSDELEPYFSQFQIHNDATESYSPDETCNDTLSKVLLPFRDDLLETQIKKVILAINLGTLSNFLEEKKESFGKLKAFVEQNRIIEADSFHQIDDTGSNPIFRFVNFTNYHFYSLGSEGPKVDLIEELLSRIVHPSVHNPIYKAYQWVSEQAWAKQCPVKANYELLCDASFRKVIAYLLVSCLVREKQIISFRQILNFIYDLLVPYQLAQTDLGKYQILITQLSSEDRIGYLAPYYLFENPKLSKIFFNLHQLDPAIRRYEALDERCISLFTDTDPFRSLSQEFPLILSNTISLKPEERIRPEFLIKTYLRFNYFNDPQAAIYYDDYFLEYTKALYAFNNNDAISLRHTIDLVKKAAYSWNGGTLEKDKAIVPGTVKNTAYRLSKQLNLRAKPPTKEEKKHLDIIDEFSQEVILKFLLPDNQLYSIAIDYALYVLLQNVNAGYRPNKLDRHTYINFARFVEQVTFADIQGQTLYVDEINFGFPLDYKLEFNDEYQEFTFSKLHRV